MYQQDPRHYMPMMRHGIYPIPFMPACVKLASAYVPYQCYMQAYPLPEALMKGTLFPELYQPYIPEEKLKKEGN
ncbi:spore coat associated protein CotJA [Alkaliphilus transvaalensis]|uniref:spore coat associated protein CotJA n=1 Tax=Alkaliphilus transvaalensis TaxID=114628 RepID=UPI0005515381|nr:spore coat associated protein CotJA [Alkaliphilus transvaalensis]